MPTHLSFWRSSREQPSHLDPSVQASDTISSDGQREPRFSLVIALFTVIVGGIGLSQWKSIGSVLGITEVQQIADASEELLHSGIENAIHDLSPEWILQAVRKLPEKVSALTSSLDDMNNYSERLFVGTEPRGTVAMFHVNSAAGVVTEIASALGDATKFGQCVVNHLAIRDLDHDGVPELLASTSQILPAGRPRLYAWRLNPPAITPVGIARPDIASHWSHGIAFSSREGDRSESVSKPESVFITFCGEGEVVEYQLVSVKSENGFVTQNLASKVVGQLPASGEWSQSDDVDGDGRTDICLATGYAENMAAILIYSVNEPGQTLTPKVRIDEGARFANVRFISADMHNDGSRDLFAWWQTDHLYGGESEMISYRIGPEGVLSRQLIAKGHAIDLQPDDGQFQVADLDRDGQPEVWFSTGSGTLMRYTPGSIKPLERILKLDGGIGPITVGPRTKTGERFLYMGWGQYVTVLKPTRSVESSSDRDAKN